MKKRILSIVLCLMMVLSLLPVQAFANDYEDGTECAYCDHYHWGDYMCDVCGMCSEDCSNSECFTTTHCNDCGACLMRNDFCAECRRCEDCMKNEAHCLDCGRCFVGESKDELCEGCSRCADCVGEICGECHQCDSCAGFEHCEECSAHLYEDPCKGCFRCADCGSEICDYCGYCEDCIEEYELHCVDCGECFEVEDRCSDPEDDATHCVNCAGLICEECGSCEYEGADFCIDCGLCAVCCAANAEAEGCSTGEVCVESVEWDDHICEKCEKVCFCEEEPCEDCGLCKACCKEISRENGCSTGEVCVESADWNEHFCRDCGKCFHEASQCEYCGLCAVCCAANAEAEGCDCGDVCMKKDGFTQHLTDYHNAAGTVPENHEHKFKNEWSMDGDSHWHDCRFCDKEKSGEAVHVWNTEGKCSTCGYERDAKLRITVQPKDVTCTVSDPFAHTGDPYDIKSNTTSFSVTVKTFDSNIESLDYQWYQVRTKKDDLTDSDDDALIDNDNEYVVRGAQTDTLTISVPNDGCGHKYEYYCVITAKDAEGNEVFTVTSRAALLRTVHNYGALEPVTKAASGVYVIHFKDGDHAGEDITYEKGSLYHNQWCCGYDCGHTMLPAGTRHNFGPKEYLGRGYDTSDAQQNMYYFYGTTCADCEYQNVYWYQQQLGSALYHITVEDTPGAYIVTDDDREIISGYVRSGEDLVVSAPYVNEKNEVFSGWKAYSADDGTLLEDFEIKNEIRESALGNASLKMPACNIKLVAVYSDKGPVNKVTIKGAGENPVLVENGVITVRVGTEFSVDTILTPEDAVEKRVIWTVYGTKATGESELGFTPEYRLNSSGSTVSKAITGPVTLKANETGTFRLRVRTVESQMLEEWVSDTVFVKIVPADAHVHDYDTTTVPATCSRSGYTLYTCKDAACGKTYKSDFVKATGHEDRDGDGLCDNFDLKTNKFCGYKMDKETTMFGRTRIDTVQLSVSSPLRGETPDNANLKDSAEARYSVAYTDWDPVTENNKFGISTKYTVKVVLEAVDNYGFKLNGLLGIGNTEFFINGKKATVVSGDAQQVTIIYEFQAYSGGGSGSSGGSSSSDSSASAVAAKDIKSSNTGDAGIALYAAMGLLSLTGGAWVVGKKRRSK